MKPRKNLFKSVDLTVTLDRASAIEASTSQIYIVKARCVTTRKARKDGCLPAPAPVGRRKIMIMNNRGTMII